MGGCHEKSKIVIDRCTDPASADPNITSVNGLAPGEDRQTATDPARFLSTHGAGHNMGNSNSAHKISAQDKYVISRISSEDARR